MFDSKDLSVLAYSNGFTLWHYRCSGPSAEAESAGYFDRVANIFNAGDLIFISAQGGPARRTFICSVEGVENGSVKVSRIGI